MRESSQLAQTPRNVANIPHFTACHAYDQLVCPVAFVVVVDVGEIDSVHGEEGRGGEPGGALRPRPRIVTLSVPTTGR